MIIVTGGAGFIGSAVVWQLNKAGQTNILLVDDLGSTEKWKNLIGLEYQDLMGIDEFYTRIIEDNLQFSVETIIHMGACSSTTEKDADHLLKYNFQHTVELVRYALPRQCRIIYASSAATYGDGSKGYNDDDSLIKELRPLNMYGFSKQMVDIWAYNNQLLDKIVGLKFFNVYGPNEFHKGDMRSVVHKAYEQIQSTGKVNLFKSYNPNFNDGEQKRDFVYIKDAVDVVMYFLEHRNVNGLFNVGSGSARTWNDLVNSVFIASSKKTQIDYIDMPEEIRDNYQYFTVANLDKLRKAGYKKEMTSLEDGIKEYVQEYLLKKSYLAY